MNDCEESDFVFKWTNSCRLCLSTEVKYDIFLNDESTNFIEKIKSCLNFLIYRGDPMPQKLCSECWKQLESWSTFREKCVETDKNLKRRLKPFRKVEFVDEYLKKCSAHPSISSAESEFDNNSLEPDTAAQQLLDDQSKSTDDNFSEAHQIVTTKDPILKPADSTNSLYRLIKTEIEAHTDDVWTGEGVIATVEGGASGVYNCSAAENVLVKQELIGDMCSVCHKKVESDVDHICGGRTNEMEVDVVDIVVDVDGNENEEQNGAYNLRSKLDTTNVSYEELEDWVEEEAVSQLSPVPKLQPRKSSRKITPFKCSLCQVYFESKALLQSHYDSSECIGSLNERHSCKVCQRVYFSLEELAEHQVRHLNIAYNLTVDELLRCAKCNLLFADVSLLQQHAAQHLIKPSPPLRKYNCSKCLIVFTRRSDYDRHRKAHTPIKRRPQSSFKCDLCSSKCFDEERLIDHRFLFHGLPDERVNCQTCNLKFPDLKALAAHALSHRPGPVARKTTTQTPTKQRREPPAPVVANKIVDVAVKVDVKPIRCRRCGRIFKSEEDLRQHEVTIHKNLSPHYCRKCSRRFATRSQLLFHYRSHFKGQPAAQAEPESKEAIEIPDDDLELNLKPGDARLICEHCDIQFHHQGDLIAHTRTHNSNPGRKHITKNIFKVGQSLVYKYQCSKCPQLFCSRGSLNRHRDSAHVGEEVDFIRLRKGIVAKKTEGFPCTQCNTTFLTKSKRTLHFRQEHRTVAATFLADQNMELGNEPVVAGNGCVPCQFCNKIFNYSYIARHIRQEHRVMGEGTTKAGYQCRFCSKICSTSFNIQKHESCHDPDRKHKYLCKICGQGSDNYTVYQKHKKHCSYTVTKSASPVVAGTPPTPPSSVPPRPIAPESLGMSFDEYKMCSICLNSYETSSLLELHVMTAHGVEAFQRLEMAKPKQMAPASDPRRMRGETGQELWHEEANSIIRRVEGGFRCTYCDIHLSNVMAAMYHRSQHPHGNLYIVQVDSNVFQCTVCPNVLRTRHEALYHAELHAEPKDVKPPPLQGPIRSFNCPFCSSTFNCEDSIRSHIYYVHPEGLGNSL